VFENVNISFVRLTEYLHPLEVMISSGREDGNNCLSGRCNSRNGNAYDSSSELGRSNRSSRGSPLLGERTGYSREGRHMISGDRAMIYPRRGSTRGLMNSLLSEAYGGGRGGELTEGLGGGLGSGLGGGMIGTRGMNGLNAMRGLGDLDDLGGIGGGGLGGGLGGRPNLQHHRFDNLHRSPMLDPGIAYMGNDMHNLRGIPHHGLGSPGIYGPREPMFGGRSPMIGGGLGGLGGIGSPRSRHASSAAISAFNVHRMDRQRMPYGPQALHQPHSNYRAPYVEDYESEADMLEEAMMQQELAQYYELEGQGIYGGGYGGGLGGMGARL
jgi:hypothetical protein